MGRKKYDRDEAVTAAMGVFWLHGFRGTSVAMLCQATGLNPKSLYAAFGSKEGLFEEALRVYTLGGLLQSRAALAREPLGLDNIRRYFSAMRYEENCRGCLMTMTINERALVPRAALDQVSETLDAIEELLRANLVAAALPTSEVEALVHFLLFSIQGITTMGKLHGDNDRLQLVVAEIGRTLDRYEDVSPPQALPESRRPDA